MEHQLSCLKTYRYFTHGDIEKSKTVIYVLHGYGQLAEYFIRKFSEVNSDFFVVAPEGMHRFYLAGSSGRVGASWMTKESRLSDIDDTLNWLESLEEQINTIKKFEKKIVIGFSQGGATAARWNSMTKNKPNNTIYWASVFPPDLKNDQNTEINNSQNYFVLGTEDEYFDSEAQKNTFEYYKNRGFNIFSFEGAHSIEKSVLTSILEKIIKSFQKL
jgi:predicted esterase